MLAHSASIWSTRSMKRSKSLPEACLEPVGSWYTHLAQLFFASVGQVLGCRGIGDFLYACVPGLSEELHQAKLKTPLSRHPNSSWGDGRAVSI